ncbi:hypothetical protein [Streptomyces sp. NPDC002250]|uniref:hypothetical protein n=1 Tax=Streptomyces sp. NPDC002250 TaxID=3364641 RepID=UPI0036CD2244
MMLGDADQVVTYLARSQRFQRWWERFELWWETTPRLIRRISAVLLVLGCLLICLGLWLDHIHGWVGHEFLINLVSSFTSLCFGVPTALLVFSHLGNAQEEARQTMRARIHARQAVREFSRTVLEPFGLLSLEELSNRLGRLREELAPVRLMRWNDPARFLILDQARAAFRDLLAEMDHGGVSLPFSDRGARDLHERERLKDWRNLIQAQWKILSTEVRPRVTDYELPWLEARVEAETTRAVEALLAGDREPWPLENDSEIVRNRRPNAYRGHPEVPAFEQGMQAFCEDLRVLCSTAEALKLMYP